MLHPSKEVDAISVHRRITRDLVFYKWWGTVQASIMKLWLLLYTSGLTLVHSATFMRKLWVLLNQIPKLLKLVVACCWHSLWPMAILLYQSDPSYRPQLPPKRKNNGDANEAVLALVLSWWRSTCSIYYILMQHLSKEILPFALLSTVAFVSNPISWRPMGLSAEKLRQGNSPRVTHAGIWFSWPFIHHICSAASSSSQRCCDTHEPSSYDASIWSKPVVHA